MKNSEDTHIANQPFLPQTTTYLILLLGSLLLSLLIFFIDEANYNFDGLFTKDNLLFLSVIWVCLFAGMFFTYRIIGKRLKPIVGITVAIVLGMLLGVLLYIGLFFLWGLIYRTVL